MKVVFLSDVERFCSEHNLPCISLKVLRDIAAEEEEDVKQSKAFKAGYAMAHDVIINALAKEKP